MEQQDLLALYTREKMIAEEKCMHLTMMLARTSTERDVLLFAIEVLDKMELPIEGQIVVQAALARLK